jgi:hypothetical protein
MNLEITLKCHISNLKVRYRMIPEQGTVALKNGILAVCRIFCKIANLNKLLGRKFYIGRSVFPIIYKNLTSIYSKFATQQDHSIRKLTLSRDQQFILVIGVFIAQLLAPDNHIAVSSRRRQIMQI